MKQPDPKLHRDISFAKSGLRIAAGVLLATGHFIIAGIVFVFAECLGIVEELV